MVPLLKSTTPKRVSIKNVKAKNTERVKPIPNKETTPDRSKKELITQRQKSCLSPYPLTISYPQTLKALASHNLNPP